MTPEERFKRDLIKTFEREAMRSARVHAAKKRFLAEANLRAMDEWKANRQALRGIISSTVGGIVCVGILLAYLDYFIFGIVF